jgi:hypothetical protein
VWVLNIVRIEAIFVAGLVGGRSAALDVLHPVAGLVAFNIGVLLMLAAVPRFGLSFIELPPRPAASYGLAEGGRRIRIGLLAMAVAGALALTAVNAGYARYEAIASGLGLPRIGGLDASLSTPEGWSSGFVANFDGARPFYGPSAEWVRYQYVATPTASLGIDRPVYMDVISTDDWQALDAYGLEACYNFHGYRIHSQAEFELPGGLTGSVINYRNAKAAAEWSAVWWEWPSDVDGQVRYERVVLFVANAQEAAIRGITEAGVSAASDRTNAFLMALATKVVERHLASAETGEVG